MMKKPLIILTGPTAVGKTELSISLAEMVQGSIISADSMQVYRHMDIGTAKIKPEEMRGIPHYLIDILEPWEEFHVARFQEYARACMEEIYAQGRIPIIVGGTGFYIQAVLYGVEFTEGAEDTAFRRELESFAREMGAHALHERLAAVDPEAAANIHENNVKRTVRALEFYHLTGKKISEHNAEERRRKTPYQSAYFVLDDDRERLYERINCRVDKMLKDGLVEEVERLRAMGCHGKMVSMQGLGYKEILDYLEGNCTLEDAAFCIRRDTRHFAKRQLTWFRRERDVIWVNKPKFRYDNAQILSYLLEELQKRHVVGE